VSLYVDCDVKSPVDVVVERLPRGLMFDTGSVVYVAQAGPQFAQHFEVDMYVGAFCFNMLPSVKFAEDKVLTFLILREKC